MFMKSRRLNIRMLERILDVIYVICCVLIIGLAVFLCMKPVDHAYCYPIIFGLAAGLNLLSAYSKLNRFSPNHGHSTRGVFYLICGIALAILTIASLISVMG